MSIKVKIVNNDTTNVAKIVLINSDFKILLLKRSENIKKFPGEWDLPGGHTREGESIIQGLRREVKEETDISLKSATFFKKIENLNFFFARYDQQPIKISHEHTEYKFFDKTELDSGDKFQNVAIEVLRKVLK